ncbi:UNVERIFIED_CONTAM: hypothetical protein FKN15_035674 [Acipenser sinensis]
MSLNTKAVPKDFVFVEPNSNVGAAIDVGSNGNTLLISDIGWKASGQASAQIRYSIPEEPDYGVFVGNVAEDLGLDIKRLSDRRNKASVQISYSIPEELNYGAFVGSVAVDLGLDIKKLSNHRFRIVSGSKQQLLQNDNAPVILSPIPKNGTVTAVETIPRNVERGYLITKVRAYDADIGTSAQLSYSIPEESNHGTFVGNIAQDLGIDIKELENRSFCIDLVSEQQHLQNDNAPVILSPLSKDGSAEAVETIPRNVKTGYLVTKVRAHDADIGYNAWLSFSLQQATDPTLFGLERNTGAIKTLRPLTENDATEHKLIIVVKDNGNYSLSTTATIRITTVENTEAFAFSDSKTNTKQQEGNNLTFYLIITLGSISSLFVVSIITLIAIQCHRPRDYISTRYSHDTNYAEVRGDGSLCQSYQYRAAENHFMFIGPAMNIGSASGVGNHRNTLVIADNGMKASGELS